jgi:4-amino-4-deoxy-L-arabinose transferase-like glycosyltransferase
LVGVVIGSHPLVEPDEGRNASAAREVAEHGGWMLPRYDSLPLLDKPPLWFDAAAGAMRVLGPSETAARLPSLLAAALTVALAGAFAGRLFGPGAVAPAALALATMPMLVAYATIAIFDPLLTLFVTVTLIAGYHAVEGVAGPAAPGRDSRRWSLLFWIGLVLGVFTKGPVALALPVLVCVPYGLWRRRPGALWSWPGCLVALVTLGPWLASVEARVPGFLRYGLLTETWLRVSTDDLHRNAPFWYFVPYLLGGAAPWSVAAITAWMGRVDAARRRDPRLVFLLLWLGAPLVLFSLSSSKRPHYVLPLLPAIGLLLAARWHDPAARRRALVAGAATTLVLGALMAYAGLWLVPASRRMDPVLRGPAESTALALAAIALTAGVLGLAWRHSATRGLWGLGVPLVLLPLAALPLVGALSARRSAAGLARVVELRCPGAPVVGLDVLPTSLPFYLGRPVGLASPSGRPFPSTWVELHWRAITAAREGSGEQPLLTSSAWPRLPHRAVVVAGRRDQAAELGALSSGFVPLGGDDDRTLYGRGCEESLPRRAQPSGRSSS